MLGALLVSLVLATAGDETYAAQVKSSNETGRPLVVLLSADYCPHCRVMEGRINQAKAAKELDGINLAYLNTERDSKARALQAGNDRIPQLIVVRLAADGGWETRRVIGSQSREVLSELLKWAREPAAKP